MSIILLNWPVLWKRSLQPTLASSLSRFCKNTILTRRIPGEGAGKCCRRRPSRWWWGLRSSKSHCLSPLLPPSLFLRCAVKNIWSVQINSDYAFHCIMCHGVIGTYCFNGFYMKEDYGAFTHSVLRCLIKCHGVNAALSYPCTFYQKVGINTSKWFFISFSYLERYGKLVTTLLLWKRTRDPLTRITYQFETKMGIFPVRVLILP